MNKLIAVLVVVAMSGCKFDSGSKNYSKSIGKSISLECFKNNLKHIDNVSVSTETSKSIILVGAGIKSTVEFEAENSVVTSYSILTETEKSEDGVIHKQIENAANLPCKL